MRIKPIVSALKWLYPGMRVKRWLALVPVGMAVCLFGLVLLLNWKVDVLLSRVAEEAMKLLGINMGSPEVWIPMGVALVILGVIIIFIALRQVVRSITSVVSPETEGKLADLVFRKRYLSQGQRIVVIGGGTGLSTMLRGLKQYSSNITAVVTTTDDGGSSGRLREDMGMLPPGDIRNCLVALADSETSMADLFQYRFDLCGDGLEGHSFGNLLIAAMTRLTGDFESAVRETSRILAIRGQVLPTTTAHVKLQAELEDGTFVEGETNIAKSTSPIKHIMLSPTDVEPLEETLAAIELADCVVLGPGSVYTSIVPNLLVKGIPEALHKTKGTVVYVCNVMTQQGETDNYKASDHVKAITKHIEPKIIDRVLVNTARPQPDMLELYRRYGQTFVEPDPAKIREMGYRPVTGDFISESNVVRHDPDKLANAILRMLY